MGFNRNIFLALILFTSTTAGFYLSKPAHKASQLMAYGHEQNKVYRIALAQADGTFLRFLTPADKAAYHPDISADGSQVAYSLGTIVDQQKSSMAIHVQHLKTGDVEVWTKQASQYVHVEFSGDGKYLAYSGPSEDAEGKVTQLIHLLDLEKERAKGPVRSETIKGVVHRFYQPTPEVIPHQHNSFLPAISSDASVIVFQQTRNNHPEKGIKELVLFDRKTGERKKLTDENSLAMAPSFSADNRWLTYAQKQQGQWDIYLRDLWSDQSVNLTQSSAINLTPVFAPDGSITFTEMKKGDGKMSFDLLRIASEQVMDRTAKVVPSPFIADVKANEYLPSFSGQTSYKVKQMSALPSPARSSFGSVHHQGQIYIAGGHQGREHHYPRESFVDRLNRYNFQTNQWSEGARLEVPRQGFELVAHKNFIYAFGGFTFSAEHSPKWKSVDIIERYDIAKNQWEILPAKLVKPRSSNIVAQVGTKVYIMGGWDATPNRDGDKYGTFHRSIEVFDLETETIEETPYLLPDPLRRAFTSVVVGDEIYLLGGIKYKSHFDWLDEVTSFNVRTAKWTEHAKLPFPTFAPGAGVWEDKIYLFGGMNKTRNYINTIFSFRYGKDLQWKNTGRYLKENKGFAQVVSVPGAKGLAVLGGHTYDYSSGKKQDTPVRTFEFLSMPPSAGKSTLAQGGQ